MSQSVELDDELLPEFDFAPGAVRPTELDLDAIFDLELERKVGGGEWYRRASRVCASRISIID